MDGGVARFRAASSAVAAWSWSFGTTVFWMALWMETGVGEMGSKLADATTSGDGSGIKRGMGRVVISIRPLWWAIESVGVEEGGFILGAVKYQTAASHFTLNAE